MDDIVFVETNATGHGARALSHCAKLGLRSVFLTCQPDYYGTQTLSLVDRWELVDTTDPQAMLSRIRPKSTLGVLTFLDYPLLPTIELAKKVGAPHPDSSATRRCRAKDLTRQAIGQGPDQPQYRIIDKTYLPKTSPVGYPCVVKPVDDSGSLGVHICSDRANFLAAIERERDRNVTARGFALSPRLLVEEYIEGPEFSAELIFSGGKWHLLGVTRKIMSPPPHAVSTGHIFPALLDPYTYRSIHECVIKWMSSTGLNYGAAHVEFRLSERGPVLIEANPRLGGALISELIRHATAFDVVDDILRLSCGLPRPEIQRASSSSEAAAILYLHGDHRGKVASVNGAEELESMSNVLEYQLPRVGDECRPLVNDYDRLGHVIARGSDEHDALRNAENALSCVSIDIQR